VIQLPDINDEVPDHWIPGVRVTRYVWDPTQLLYWR